MTRRPCTGLGLLALPVVLFLPGGCSSPSPASDGPDARAPDGDAGSDAEAEARDGDVDAARPVDAGRPVDADRSAEADADVEAEGPVYVGAAPVFEQGPLAVDVADVAEGELGAPRFMQVYVPEASFEYPVVLFHHGFSGDVRSYTELLTHLSSHGFVVAAPQMYSPGTFIGAPTTQEEAEAARTVHEFLLAHLAEILAGADATPRVDRLGLAAHSRGGKLIWLMAEQGAPYASALAGVDPVDGTFEFGFGTGEPRLIEGPFGHGLPSLVLGTGRGPEDGVSGMACAPEGDNHEQFFESSAAPAFHVVVPGYGHTDMMDPDMPPCGLFCCPGGEDLAAMRRLTAGLLVAFFRATLGHDEGSYGPLRTADGAPLPIEVEWR